jgi:hypothetical protein
MANKPQPWPSSAYPFCETIVSKNDLFVMSLVLAHKELKADNPKWLAGLLPSLEAATKIIYDAAIELGPIVEEIPADELPLWARQINKIVKEYPAVLLKLRELEPILRAGRVIDARREIVELFNISAKIQVQFIKIALDKKNYVLSLTKIDQISEEIENHK